MTIHLYKTLVGPKTFDIIKVLPLLQQLVLIYGRCLATDPIRMPTLAQVTRNCRLPERAVRKAYETLRLKGWWTTQWLRKHPPDERHEAEITILALNLLLERFTRQEMLDLLRLLSMLNVNGRFESHFEVIARETGLPYRRVLQLLDFCRRRDVLQADGYVVPYYRRS